MNERMSLEPEAFELGAGFDAGETHGGIRLGKFEAMYEEVFAEVIEDGVVTVEERARLDQAAESMGLDRERLARLEAALQAAWESHHKVQLVVHGAEPEHEEVEVEAEIEHDDDHAPVEAASPTSPTSASADESAVVAVPVPHETAAEMATLRAELHALKARVRQLEHELEEARNNVSIEVDLGAVAQPMMAEDPTDLQRRIRQDPTNPEPMRLLFRWAKEHGKLDEQWCIASALQFLGRATPDELAVFEQHRRRELPRPKTALSHDAWRRMLFHPDEELLVGDIFSVITSAVLLGRVSALRRDKLLPKLDAERLQDPASSTVSAVRAVAWSAAMLGMKPPSIYVDPELRESITMIPGVPPSLRIGSLLLRGRTPLEAAFECGRALASFREEHFVRFLFPGVPDLEDMFLAALSIASPSLPIPPHAKARVEPIAAAIQPVLEPHQVDRLRGYFLRFVEEGGRTNLQRWAHGVDRTATRAGFLLCNDLQTAGKVLGAEEASEDGQPGDRMQDLLVFASSERYFLLRKQLGIALD